MSLSKTMYNHFQNYSAPAVVQELATQMQKEFVDSCDATESAPYREAIALIKKAENVLRDAGC